MSPRMPLKERLSMAMENAVRDVLQTHCPDLDIDQIISDTDFSLFDPVKPKSKNKSKKASASHEERALLPFNPDKCHARIYGSRFGCQCNSKPADSGTLCKTHSSSHKFGLFNGPKPSEISWKIVDGNVADAVALIEGPPDIPGSPKKPVKKKEKKQKKELSPEIIALKDEYESILGKKPAGPKCNDPLWLEQKINEKKDPPPVKMKKNKKAKKPIDPPEEPEDIAKDIDELAEDLENAPDYTGFDYQGVEYLLVEATDEVFNDTSELIGHLQDGVLNFINETFRTRHEQERGSDESDESDESSDDDSDGE